MGKNLLTGREQLLFWRLAHHLITVHQCRLIRINEEHSEIWLETIRKQNVNVIRLVATDLDWSNWMKQDIEIAGMQAEKLRRLLYRRNLRMLNIYISPFPPVDDYEHLLKQSFIVAKGRTVVDTVLLTEETMQRSTGELQSYFPELSDLYNEEVIDYSDIENAKQLVLQTTTHQMKQERELFQQGKPFFTYFFIAVQLIMFLIIESMGGVQMLKHSLLLELNIIHLF